MKYTKEFLTKTAEDIKDLRRRLLKSFRPGLSGEQIESTNRQLDALNIAREAVERITPMACDEECCAFCNRSLKTIFAAAEDRIYCCPYCGQALEEAEES